MGNLWSLSSLFCSTAVVVGRATDAYVQVSPALPLPTLTVLLMLLWIPTNRGSEKYEDESFVLPALIKFNGEPFVDDEGRLLYKFPELQSTAALPSVRLTATEAKVPLEKEWAFSEAGPGEAGLRL